jgi:hypothetical protein
LGSKRTINTAPTGSSTAGMSRKQHACTTLRVGLVLLSLISSLPTLDVELFTDFTLIFKNIVSKSVA